MYRVKFCRYLGVLIDEELRWVHHIDYLKTKLIKFVGIFYKIRGLIPSKILQNLYYSFIYPHLTYCIEIYANTCYSYLDPLIKLNNKLLRILQNRKNDAPLSVLYKNYNTLMIPELYTMYVARFVRKCQQNRHDMPGLFSNFFSKNCDWHNHYTRQSMNLHIDRANCSFGQRTIKYSGSQIWNQIPKSIQMIRSEKKFTQRLKDLYRTQYKVIK